MKEERPRTLIPPRRRFDENSPTLEMTVSPTLLRPKKDDDWEAQSEVRQIFPSISPELANERESVVELSLTELDEVIPLLDAMNRPTVRPEATKLGSTTPTLPAPAPAPTSIREAEPEPAPERAPEPEWTECRGRLARSEPEPEGEVLAALVVAYEERAERLKDEAVALPAPTAERAAPTASEQERAAAEAAKDTKSPRGTLAQLRPHAVRALRLIGKIAFAIAAWSLVVAAQAVLAARSLGRRVSSVKLSGRRFAGVFGRANASNTLVTPERVALVVLWSALCSVVTVLIAR